MVEKPGFGPLLYVRYEDHVLFKGCDASRYFPWTRETIGWLDYEDNDSMRTVWERHAEPPQKENVLTRSIAISLIKICGCSDS